MVRMKRKITVCAVCLAALAGFGDVAEKVRPFALEEVELRQGRMLDIRDRNEKYLMEDVDCDRLLAVFREVALLPKKAERYGGKWEGKGINGHSLGHYLSALSALYADKKGTGNTGHGTEKSNAEEIKKRIDYIVDELKACQQANGDGYCLTVDKEVYDLVRTDKFYADRFTLNGWWVPNYTLHKVFAGLRDAYRLAGNKTALEVESKLGKWYAKVVKDLSDARIKRLLRCEWGGLNETFTQLYEDTGDEEFLYVATNRFNDGMFALLDSEPPKLNGLHANTQIPKIVGLAEIYEATGEEIYRKRVENFFWDVVNNRTLSMGGHGEHEHFYDMAKGREKLGPLSCETCNINNMFKLARYVFSWNPDSRIMDYVERALYNQLVANIGPGRGEYGYFLSLAPVAHKIFSTPDMSWWCCVGTGMENPQHYQELAYIHSGDTLYVNLFMPTHLKSGDIEATMKTDFPRSGDITLSVKGVKYVKIRKPFWADGMTINGKEATPGADGYIDLDISTFQPSTFQLFNLHMPMAWRVERLPHDEKMVSFMKGPLVYVENVPPQEGVADPAVRRYAEHLGTRGMTGEAAKPIVADTDEEAIAEFLKRPHLPFMDVYHEHYTLYFPLMSKDKWKEKAAELAAEEAAKRAAAAKILDIVEPGFQQSEIDHDFKDFKTDSGDMGDRKFRIPVSQYGWFSYTMKVDPGKPCKLVGVFSNNTRNKYLRITIDDVLLSEVHLERGKHKTPFYEEMFSIPTKLTKGKTSVTVKISAVRGKGFGELLGLRTEIE